jgi:hypothetical protein
MSRPAFDRRRRILLDRDLQVRLVARIAIAFVASLLLFLAFSLGMPVLLGAFMGLPDWGVSAFGFRVRFVLAFVALPLLSAILVLFAVGVRATFRVAGPLYRFGQVFRDLAGLRVPRGVRIRRDDLLQETAFALDRALVELHDHLDRLQERARAAVEELETQVDTYPQLAASLRGLRAELHALDQELTKMKLLPRAPHAEEPAAADPGDVAASAPPAAPRPLVR